jgi:hypothetical protein
MRFREGWGHHFSLSGREVADRAGFARTVKLAQLEMISIIGLYPVYLQSIG